MTTDYSISVIVPIYNEVDLVEPSISQLTSFLQSNFTDYEILIVESGSTDGSKELCDHLAADLPCLTVIHEEKKSGFGSALRMGYACAKKDLIWLVVVDMPFPLETVLTALPLFAKYNCVFSYRSKDNRDVAKRLRSYIYNMLAKAVLGLKVKHVNSAFRVFKREVIQGLSFESNDWALDAEVLYKITKRKVPYIEIPVELRERLRGRTSISISDPLSMLISLFRIRRMEWS